MKALKDFYSFVFGKSKPNKKRKLTPPSERPKNAYLKYVEHGLINEGILIGQYTGEWVKDQKAWYKYFKANKDFVMINIHRANQNYSIGWAYKKDYFGTTAGSDLTKEIISTNTHSDPKPKMTIKPGKPLDYAEIL